MTVHDYEIKSILMNLKRIPCCDLLHPDHCLTKKVSEIARHWNGFKFA